MDLVFKFLQYYINGGIFPQVFPSISVTTNNLYFNCLFILRLFSCLILAMLLNVWSNIWLNFILAYFRIGFHTNLIHCCMHIDIHSLFLIFVNFLLKILKINWWLFYWSLSENLLIWFDFQVLIFIIKLILTAYVMNRFAKEYPRFVFRGRKMFLWFYVFESEARIWINITPIDIAFKKYFGFLYSSIAYLIILHAVMDTFEDSQLIFLIGDIIDLYL